jgi:hypothetical protein
MPRAWPDSGTYVTGQPASSPGNPAAHLEYVPDVTGWPRRSDRVLSTARATYRWLPQGTRLWVRQSDYELLDLARLRNVFMTLA